MTRIAYSVQELDFTSAGSEDVGQISGFLRFLRAEDAAGVEQPSALAQVRMGHREGALFPLKPGDVVKVGSQQPALLHLEWAAQANVATAYFVIAYDPFTFDVEARPAASVVVGELASSIAASAVSVAAAATLLAAANATRKAITFKNLGTVAVYIGAAGVTTAAGLQLNPGESYSTETTNAAFYGIAASAGQDVRVLEEG